jgi:alpha-glucosidase
MRPLFFEKPEEKTAWSHRLYSYLLGNDLLVAPVIEPGKDLRKVWLPGDQWNSLWSGEAYPSGWSEVPAPMGKPPVFYRSGSAYSELFASIAHAFG